jgi:hypothetical protein
MGRGVTEKLIERITFRLKPSEVESLQLTCRLQKKSISEVIRKTTCKI